MKKAFRIVAIVAILSLVLAIAACLVVPKIAKNYIEEHSRELVGRRIGIGNISFNPFRFTLAVENLALYEADDSTRFVAFREFFVNADPSCLFVGDICLSEVRLDSPYARVVKNGSAFNFSDILSRFAAEDSSGTGASAPDSATTMNPAEGMPFGVRLRRIAVISGDVILDDREVGSHIEVKDFSLNVPELYFSNKNTSAGVNLEFASGGSLGVQADYNLQQGDFTVDVDLSDFSISAVKPYLENVLSFGDLAGTLDAKLSVSGNIADPMALNAAGTVSLDSVVLTEISGQTLGVRHIGAGIAEADLGENRFVIDSVVVDGGYAHFDLDKNSNNFDRLLRPGTKEAREVPETDSLAAPAKKIDALLKRFSVSNTRFSLNDNTIPGGFHYAVLGIRAEASDVAFDKRTNFAVRATLPKGGSVSVSAKCVPMDPMTDLQANIVVKNVNMQDFSKYSEHYTGYPFVAGSFGFASDNAIRGDAINSRNNIDIYNLTVGDKPGNAKPEYAVPMKVALYILKDKDGKIAFDVPVKGSLKDPEFSYGKIIWQTVMNLMVKVALSPAKFLMGENTPSDFEFDVVANDFTSEQYAIAEEWTKLLSSRPGSKLSVLQSYNPKKQLDKFALGLEKIEFYKAQAGVGDLTPVNRKAALDIETSDSAFAKFDSSWTRLPDEILAAELQKLAEERNAKLQKVLSAQPGVTAKNLMVRMASQSERLPGSKSVFRMSIELP